MVTSKTDLYAAYRGEVSTGLLPYPIIKLCVNEMKSFLLGDGYEMKVQILASDTAKQEKINTKIKQLKLLPLLDEAYTDVLVSGEGYIDYSSVPLRRIKAETVTSVAYDPEDPTKVVQLTEKRQVWSAAESDYVEVEVQHSLIQPDTNEELDLLNLQSYKYQYQEGDKEPITPGGDVIPIVRIPNELDGMESASAIETLIHAQLEYNDVRSRLHEWNKHHKPQMYSIGTSMPQIVARTNKERPEEVSTPSGSATFQTSFNTGEASIIHLPISAQARDAGIPPKLGYTQPQDSSILERQRQIILHDVYFQTGVLILELENARSASSSSSLSILYEPLKRTTHRRAQFLLAAIELLLTSNGIKEGYTIKLPDMLPRNMESERLELEKVKNKLISRKSSMIKQGLTVQEAEKELEQLEAERTLAVQFSGSIIDQLETPNVETGKSMLAALDEGGSSYTDVGTLPPGQLPKEEIRSEL